MAVGSKHPSFDKWSPLWTTLGHVYEGEATIKSQTTRYLPTTAAMEIDGMEKGKPGYAAYQRYLQRAVFPSDFSDAVEALVGIMHRKEGQIDVPSALEPMLDTLSAQGESALGLLRRVNETQLAKGRLGLLVDIPDGTLPAETLPYVAVYDAEAIINWSVSDATKGPAKLELVVLDESGPVQQKDLSWQDENKIRVLAMVRHLKELDVWKDDKSLAEGVTGAPTVTDDTYVVAVTDSKEASLSSLTWRVPHANGRSLDRIPFVFVNTLDLAPEPAKPPLLGLAECCLAIYRGEADYRQQLFAQGQDTLFIYGDEEDPTKPDTRLGVGAVQRLSNEKAHAEFVGVTSSGLSEQREALKSDYDRAAQRGMRLIDMASGDGGQESGEALKVRVAARTASAMNVALAGGGGLQEALRIGARWLGSDEEAVVVTVNTDFAESVMTGEEMMAWTSAKNLGAPITWRTIWEMAARRGVTSFEAFEDEQAEIDTEAPLPGSEEEEEPEEEDEPPDGGSE